MTTNNQQNSHNSKTISISGPLTAMCFRTAVSVDYLQKAITNGAMSGRADVQNAHKDANAEVLAAIEQFEAELKRIDNRLQKKTRGAQNRRPAQNAQSKKGSSAPKKASTQAKAPAAVSPKKSETTAKSEPKAKPAAKAKAAPKAKIAKVEATQPNSEMIAEGTIIS